MNKGLIIGTIFALVLAVLAFSFFNFSEAEKIIISAKWQFLVFSLVFTSFSYFFLSFGFVLINKIFGIEITGGELFTIGFVSIALNHLFSLGGVAGYTLRLLAMRGKGVRAGDILAASLFHSYLNNLVMFLLVPLGLFYLVLNHPFSSQQIGIILFIAFLLLIFLALAALILFEKRLRENLANNLLTLIKKISGRDFFKAVGTFNGRLNIGVEKVREKPGILLFPVLVIVLDWISSIFALWFCFLALGEPLGFGVLLTGFAVGIGLGFISMVPGGLGIQDGSMVGVYVLLGVVLEKAVITSILFRIIYYLIPFIVSLVFYVPIIKKGFRES